VRSCFEPEDVDLVYRQAMIAETELFRTIDIHKTFMKKTTGHYSGRKEEYE
jgi:hypothetical protein